MSRANAFDGPTDRGWILCAFVCGPLEKQIVCQLACAQVYVVGKQACHSGLFGQTAAAEGVEILEICRCKQAQFGNEQLCLQDGRQVWACMRAVLWQFRQE